MGSRSLEPEYPVDPQSIGQIVICIIMSVYKRNMLLGNLLALKEIQFLGGCIQVGRNELARRSLNG
jgi:hypothetical protein